MSGIRLESFTGAVLNSQKHSKTHVYSEGGGGYVGKYGGRVSAPNVKSYNTTQHEIFLQLRNGQELSISLPFDNIPLRQGHVITLTAAYPATTNSGYYVALCNHNTREVFRLDNKQIWQQLGLYKVELSAIRLPLMAISLVALASGIVWLFSLSPMIPVLLSYLVLPAFIVALVRHNKIQKTVKKHFEQQVEDEILRLSN